MRTNRFRTLDSDRSDGEPLFDPTWSTSVRGVRSVGQIGCSVEGTWQVQHSSI
jgi:hypothetical protein